MPRSDAHACIGPNKVYSRRRMALLSDPPVYVHPWICRVCGYEGEDRVNGHESDAEYDALVVKKVEGGFRR